MQSDFLHRESVQDKIIESIFLDTNLWAEVIEHGRTKGMPMAVLMFLQSPQNRADLYLQIASGEYVIQPPHTGYRPKEDGGERTFFANEPLDRLLLNAIYKWLMRNESAMVHSSCRSYQEGIGVGQTVKWLSRSIVNYSKDSTNQIVGCKFDIRKYFESVGREHIHTAFDIVEAHHGHSAIIDLLRKYYDSDVYYDSRKKGYVEAYQGIKQGCAVSSWLANVILYPLDEALSRLEGCYVRYSDDIIYIGKDYEIASEQIRSYLKLLGLELNEKKIEYVRSDHFFCFLGWYIRGGEITLSQKWVKKFQRTVDNITVHNKNLIRKVREIHKSPSVNKDFLLTRILNNTAKQLASILYYGDGKHSWASLTLNVINRTSDIKQLNQYCLDALRAVYTGKTSIGGLGVSKENGIQRGKGKHVSANRIATAHISGIHALHNIDGWIEKYVSIHALQKVIHNKWLYRAIVQDLLHSDTEGMYKGEKSVSNDSIDDITALEELYGKYLYSRPNETNVGRFYAKSLSDMSMKELVAGANRTKAKKELEKWLSENITYQKFPAEEGQWYWQSTIHPELVLLREWFK